MIKILLVGCGYWGKNWYKTIKNSNYELVGVVDPNPIINVDVPLFDSIEDVNIEYTHAILSVNAKLHSKIVEQLSIPDKNILVEKPCGISIRASMGPRVRTDVSILEDYMIHDLYLYLDLFGNCEVKQKSFNKEFKSPVKNSSLHLELDGMIPGYFYSSWHYPDKERKIIISGDKGSFIWVNDELYFDSTHYDNNKVIEGNRKKIELSSKSNLENELEFLIFNKPPSVNIIDVWNLITKINL